jgi:transcriptional regulator with XRE-family HTH domain
MVTELNIKKLRLSHGMSQGYLAERLGMSRPTLVKVEQGVRALTRPEEDRVRELFGMIQEQNIPSDIRISVPQKNVEKFKQVLLYILEKTGGKPNIGMTALYKLLYFIDFDYYEKYEEQLMGLTYIHNHYGPSPREFMKVVDDMKKEGSLEEVKSAYFAYEQRKFLPHKSADLDTLGSKEIKMIDSVLARYGDLSASQLTAISHEDTPWVAASDGENLDYEHVFYRPEKLSVREYDSL